MESRFCPLAGKRSRAGARACGEITAFRRQPNRKLFRQPRPGRRLAEKNDAVLQQSLLNTGVIRGAGGPPLVLALPETDGALIYTEGSAEHPLGQPRQDTGGAELAAGDEVFAVSSHDNLHSYGDASHDAAKMTVEKRIKRCPDGHVVRMAVRVKKPPSNQSGDLGLPDLQRKASQPCTPAGPMEAHAACSGKTGRCVW